MHRLLVAILSDRLEGDTPDFSALRQPPRVLRVKIGEQTQQDGDRLILEGKHDDPPGRFIHRLLRWIRLNTTFDALLVTHEDCIINPLTLLLHLTPPNPDVLIGPSEPAPQDPTAALSNDGYLLSPKTVETIARCEDDDLIDAASGAAMVANVAKSSGLDLRVDPHFVLPLPIAGRPALDKAPYATLYRRRDRRYPTPAYREATLSLAAAGSAVLLKKGLHYDRSLLRWLARSASAEIVSNIVLRNLEVEHQFDALEAELADPETLRTYVERLDKTLAQRLREEYRLLRRERGLSWPYSYLQIDNLRSLPNAKNEYANEERLVTLIFCIKNRSARTRLALRTLLSPRLLSFADVMIVEDVSDDLLDLSDLPFADRVIHFVVDTNISWTRSGLLNFGARQAKTPLLAACDADFLFSSRFPDNFEAALRSVDFSKYLLAINSYETETHQHVGGIISCAAPYGYLWVYDRIQFLKVHGFDEGFVGWGHEERELEERLTFRFGLKMVRSFQVRPDLSVFHLSHTVRTGSERLDDNRVLRERLKTRWSANPNAWGTYPLVERRRYRSGTYTKDTESARREVEASFRSSEALIDEKQNPLETQLLDRTMFQARIQSSKASKQLHRASQLGRRLLRRIRLALRDQPPPSEEAHASRTAHSHTPDKWESP